MADSYTRPYAALFLNGAWVEITQDLYGDGVYAFPIERGRRNETSSMSPTTCTLVAKNNDYKYYPKHPLNPYYGYLKKNTLARLGIDYHTMNFGTTISDSWGVTDTIRDIPGVAWTLSGTATEFDVAAGVGTITAVGAGTRAAVIGSYSDAEVLMKFSVNSIASAPRIGFAFHWQSSTDSQRLYVDTGDNGLKHTRNTGGVGTTYGNGNFTVTAGTTYWMRASMGRRMRLRIWADGSTEPTTWNHSTIDYDPFNQGFIAGHGGVGVYFQVVTGGGSGTLTVDSFEVFNPLMHGEIAEFKPSADGASIQPYVEMEVAGIFRRIKVGGSTKLESAIYREITKDSTAGYAVAYWPCEDESFATRPASGMGGEPLRVLGAAPDFGVTSPVAGTPRMLQLNAGGLSAVLPTSPDTIGNIFFRAILSTPASYPAYPIDVFTLYLSGTAERCILRFTAANSFTILMLSNTGATLFSSGPYAFTTLDVNCYWSIELVQAGADVNWLIGLNVIRADNTDIDGSLASGTFAGMTVGRITALVVAIGNNMADTLVGHIAVGNNQQYFFGSDAMIGHAGETASARLSRLCSENDIGYYLVGITDDTDKVGPELHDTLDANLQIVAATDQGVLFEPRNALEVGYRTRTNIYTQLPVTVDVSVLSSQLAPPDDDDQLANDVTATTVTGSSYRVTQRTGTNNTQPPPDGVGVYRATPDLQVIPYLDTQLPDIANNRLIQGVWDEVRHPNVTMNSRRSAISGSDSTRALLLGLIEGDYLVITNPPDWLPPEDIRLMVVGAHIDAAQLMIKQVYNTIPFGPYVIAEAGGGQRVSSGDDMVTSAQLTHLGTRLVSQSLSGQAYWATLTDDTESAGDFPFDIMIRGERMTVTAVTNGLIDDFGRTVGAGGWGTSSDGLHAYTVGSGTASYFSVNGNAGLISVATLNAEQHAVVDIETSYNQELNVRTFFTVTPTGAPFHWGCLLRWTDFNNYYWADVSVATTGVYTLRVVKRVGGAQSVVGSTTLMGIAHSTATARDLRVRILGDVISMRIYDPFVTPNTQDWQLSVTDSSLGPTATKAGVIAFVETGNTNASPVVFTFDNLVTYSPQALTVTRHVNGMVKDHGPGQPIEVFNVAYVGR